MRGYLRIYLTGYAPERFLNLCGKRDILIWDLQTTETGYVFCISIDAFRSLRPILKKTKTKAKILEKIGLPFYLFRYRKRKLFVAGVLLFLCLFMKLSGYVWNVEVIGNSYLSEETILEFLEEEDASFGTKISTIDCVMLEEALRSKYSEVIWTSIKIYGTKITVELQESLLPEDSYVKDSEEVYDIIASKDGIITYMITRTGTPFVAVGSEVKKGDILVSGEITLYQDYGEVLGYIYENADADIKAQVSYDYSRQIRKKHQEKEYLEDTKTDYVIQIGDTVLRNPFFVAPEGLYDTVAENKQFRLGENFYFPFYLKKINYKPYELVEKEYSEEEIKLLAEQYFLQYLQKLEEKGIQIIEKNVMIKKVGNSYLVTGKVMTNESIITYQPTVVHNIDESSTEGQIEE